MTPPRRVEVTAYAAHWPMAFAHEAAALQRALAPGALTLHHIGSTAVPGLLAKPTIDLMGVVDDLDSFADHDPALAGLGYVARGPSGIPGRLFYRKNLNGARTHHLHVYKQGSAHIARHLAFRDYLIAHPDQAATYGALKQRLAAAHPDDMVGYMDGKDAVVADIQVRALDWAANR